MPPGTFALLPTALLLLMPVGSVTRTDAQPRPLFGQWRVVSGVVAPWVVGDGASINRGTYLSRITEFSDTSFSGFGGALACRTPRYEQTSLPAEGLFQGNLPAPAAAAARARGFAAGPARGMRLTCSSGTFDFHAVDSTHLLIAVDNVILTLDRSPGALAAPTSPEGVVQALLERHFSGSMRFDSATATRLRPFLSASLMAHITRYLAIPASPDEAPIIDGDPFSDTQEYPTRFSVQRASITAGRAAVEVRFADGYSARTVRYHLRSGAEGWRVDNLTYEGGTTFVDQMRAPPGSVLPRATAAVPSTWVGHRN